MKPVGLDIIGCPRVSIFRDINTFADIRLIFYLITANIRAGLKDETSMHYTKH